MISTLLNSLTIIGLLIANVVAIAVLFSVIFSIVALVDKVINLVKYGKDEGGR